MMLKLPLTIAALLMPVSALAATVDLNSEIGAGSNAGFLYKDSSGFYLDGRDTVRGDASIKYLSLTAGRYVITPTLNLYNSWSRWSRSTGCDSAGENCRKGFQHSFSFFLPDTTTSKGSGWVQGADSDTVDPTKLNHVNQSAFNSSEFFKTGAQGFEAVEGTVMASFTLDQDQDVGFFIFDNKISDNRGGVSIEVSAVPLPAGLPLLLVGLGGLAIFRRNKKKA